MKALDDLGPAKLHADEQQAIRDAADALLFAFDVTTDADAKAALDHLDDVMDKLVESERLIPDTAQAILDVVEACGPQTEPLALPAAA
jgi:hypothetical protein